ncbi:MAG: DUF5309 family protein [Hyphomicrobiales bacterium]|nr:DUF5309 family protein [Hyphomicrobiales bacterium]
MATITNAQTTASAVGIREDLSDAIHRVDVEETPIMSLLGTNKATATLHEWQTRALGSVDTENAKPEGNETARAAPTQNVRRSNVCQISSKNATVSGTMEAVDKAGRNSEMALQMADRTIELRKDMDAIMFGTNQAFANAGTRTLRSFEAWIRTNTVRGVGGANPADPNVTPGTTATDGTQVAFTEAMIKTVMKAAFTASGGGNKPSKLVMGPHAKVVASGFAGRTGSTIDISKNVASSNVTKYESDFGTLDFIPHAYLRSSGRTVLGINPRMAKVSYLRKFKSYPLAKVGDADTREIISEYTLEMCNEAAHFVIADVATA